MMTNMQWCNETNRFAIEVPLRTMEVANQSFAVIRAMVEEGNPASVTDAGVGALCARSAVIGAELITNSAKDESRTKELAL